MMVQALIFLFVLTGGSTSNSDLHDPEDDHASIQLDLWFSSRQKNGGTNPDLHDPDLHDSNWTSVFIPGSFLQETDEALGVSQRIYDTIRKSEVEESSFECSWQAILKKLDLRENNDKYTVGRPVKDHRRWTWVYIEMKIFAIIDVREADQMFVSYIWVSMRWDNEHIWWDPDEFCGQKHILVPVKYLWMPDLTIVEMTERDKTAPNPHVDIHHHGWVEYRDGQVVTSTCTMHVYKFPFDIQDCRISFKSITHSEEELKLFYNTSDYFWAQWDTTDTMQTQSEWLVHYLSIHNKSVNHFGFEQTVIVYTITMKRRSELYVANFLLPIFFFLCLDFASFLMSDTGGEKVGFKVTVLLAVTVMQLILVDILPPSSNTIPLIEIYCIGAFTLMMLSLMETILVMYFKDKDRTLIDKIEVNQKLIENTDDKLNPLLCCCTGEIIYCSISNSHKLLFEKQTLV
uniref:Uncharacterized protein n=1 Tax=Oryzias latipes TaxID=8090 RepID=A0A3B3H6I2_ORYLA